MDFIVKQFFSFAKAHPILTSTNVLLSMTFPIDDVLIPYLSGKIVNNVQDGKPWVKILVTLILVLIIMQCVYTLTYWHDAILFPRLQNHVRHSILTDIVQHFQQSEEDVQTGEIMSKLVKIPLTAVYVFEQTKNYLGSYVFSFIVTSIFIILQNWVIGTVLLVSGIIVIGIISRSPKVCKKTALHQEKSLEELDETTEDVLRNLTTVYTQDQVRNELNNIEQQGTIYERYYMNTTKCTIVQKLLTILVLSIMIFIFACYSYAGIQSGKIRIGLFVSIFMIIVQWYTGLGWLSSHIKDLVMDWGILTSHTQLFEECVCHHNDANMIDQKPLFQGIRVAHITYRVKRRHKPILEDISFDVAKGDTIVVIGHIGSGKSTLLKVIARLVRPTKGEVFINGRALSRMSLQESRKLVGYVQQHPQLFNRTVYENIVYGNEQVVSRAQVIDLIQKLGLADAFDNLPDGIDSHAGKNGSILSGGQKQLVQIMRTILTNPQVIVMDEITASLDHDTKKKLFAVLDVALQGKTTIMVTHDPELMRRATRVLHLVSGHLVQPSTQ